jgi:DNA mismatch repair ATPase MutS
MNVAAIVVGLSCGGFVVYGAKATYDTWRLMRSGLQRPVRAYDMHTVARYFRDSAAAARSLPDREWADLDMDDVFRGIDRTASWPGQHLLYARLRSESLSFNDLRQFDEAVALLSDDVVLRARIQRTLERLKHPAASTLPALFGGALPAITPAARFIPLLTLVSIATLVAVAWHPPLVLAVVAMVIVNFAVRVSVQPRLEPFLPAVRSLDTLLRTATLLAEIDVRQLAPTTGALHTQGARLDWIGRATRWLSFEPTGNILRDSFYIYVNLLFLLDVSAFAWSAEELRARSATIRAVYEALGTLDVMCSVAVLRGEARQWCRPVFLPGRARTLDAHAITHPLMDDAVPNSIRIDGRNIVLTGSNMSGKSTFIRTLGVNAVLARTIHTVFAGDWRAPLLAVRSSIARADSLLDGTSYYRAEVDAIGAFFRSAEGDQRLILIDELFRGTNSIERIAAAQAVLAELDRGDSVVVIATHDVELLALLPTYASFHFREEVREGALTFDYRLHDGPCSTRNALAILELAGYPAAVVQRARQTAASLERRVAEQPSGDKEQPSGEQEANRELEPRAEA